MSAVDSVGNPAPPSTFNGGSVESLEPAASGNCDGGWASGSIHCDPKNNSALLALGFGFWRVTNLGWRGVDGFAVEKRRCESG